MDKNEQINADDLIGVIALPLPKNKEVLKKGYVTKPIIKVVSSKSENETKYFDEYIRIIGKVNILANTIDLMIFDMLGFNYNQQDTTLGWKIKQAKNKLLDEEENVLDSFNKKWNLIKHSIVAFDSDFSLPVKVFKVSKDHGHNIFEIDQKWYLDFYKDFSSCLKILGKIKKR